MMRLKTVQFIFHWLQILWPRTSHSADNYYVYTNALQFKVSVLICGKDYQFIVHKNSVKFSWYGEDA